jgi:calcium/calmodulin-dependent protein kinase I
MAEAEVTKVATVELVEAEGMVMNEPIRDFYKLGRILGQGGYAAVKSAKRLSDGQHFAVKVIHKSALNKKELKNLRIELQMVAKVKHENVVHTEAIFCPVNETDVYIVMELMAGGELFDRIVSKEVYNEQEARVAFKDMLMAVKYLHSHDIVHRDLKPENLLYQSNAPDAKLKLADFGMAHMLKDTQLLSSACGTPGYIAPEMMVKKGYGKEVDMWSLGVILYIMLSGCPPFYQEDHLELFRAIMAADYDFPSPDWDLVSPEAVDLVKGLMCLDPKVRLTPDQAMEHPFMQSDKLGGHMDIAVTKMKKYNARRRFKKGILAVQIATMMKNSTRSKNKESTSLDDGLAALKAAVSAPSTQSSDEATPAATDATAVTGPPDGMEKAAPPTEPTAEVPPTLVASASAGVEVAA